VLLKSCNGNTIFKQAIFTNYIGTIIFYIINIKIILFNKKNPYICLLFLIGCSFSIVANDTHSLG
jgi:hypothetical protein